MPLQTQKNSNPAVQLAVLALLIGVSFFATLGATPLFDVDEGAFSEATREMLISKNYLTTYLNGAPRFDKPILIYWLQLLSVQILGINEVAFRLPSAIASAVWALLLFFFVKKESDSQQALIASGLLVLSLQVSVIAKAAIADALLNCLLALSMFAVMRYYKNNSKTALLTAFAAIGLGTLTKGPIAIIIPLAVTFLFSVLEGTLKKWFRMVFYLPGIALFCVIALPWYLLEYQDQGMAFIEGFFFKHNISRFNTSLEGHSGSLFYYFPVLIVGMMPFTALLFATMWRLPKLLSTPTNRFLLIWFGFVFIFFSLSGTKLPHYMIYGYTPLFIVMARIVPQLKHPTRLVILPALLLVLLAATPMLAEQALPMFDDLYIQSLLIALAQESGMECTIVSLTTLAALIIMQLPRKLSIEAKILTTGLFFCLYMNAYLAPLVGSVLQQPIKEAALLAKQQGYKVVMWKTYNPSFLVYSESLVEKRQPQAGDVVLTTVKHIAKLNVTTLLYSKHGIVLAKVPY
uniref:Glycosyltransferase RgtA/B/C/D-like domain-containing protein n=1 Tax=Chlorobium chlorochromatii (strain CaD3) TaxID=340177 RepID=Q3ASZ6_CHLCH